MGRDASGTCHTNLIPERADITDAVALDYGDSLRRMSKKRKPPLIDLHSDDGDPLDESAER